MLTLKVNIQSIPKSRPYASTEDTQDPTQNRRYQN
jgi:hypothetical protein